MSEYQYYEFQAIDRPLSEEDIRWLRGLSTRAQITTTSFTNTYEWGDFRGDPVKLMERCFDAFVYITNWGYRRFMVRLPNGLFDIAYAKQYCHRYGVSLLKKKNYVLLDFSCDEEPGDREEWDDGSSWMASLTPLRSDLLDGDWRCLYLAWLAVIVTESLRGSVTEPPVPPGLKDLTTPLKSLVDFLRIDSELIEVAAERSGPRTANEPSAGELKGWIHSLAATEKDAWLLKIAQGREPNPHRSLLRRFREATPDRNMPPGGDGHTPGRTVAEISAAWQQRLEAKHRRLAQQAEKERERRAQADAKARKECLQRIAARAPAVWEEVSEWIAKRSPKGYDQAVKLLIDLKDAAALANRGEEFDLRLDDLCSRHVGKPSFMRRLRDAALAE